MNFNQPIDAGERSEDEGENLDQDEEEKFYDAYAAPMKPNLVSQSSKSHSQNQKQSDVVGLMKEENDQA